ncbi:MAG: hypothetical protein GC185_08350 [Alphaproteobacteria bacterium]|nr:hypothetical protein [Alphaproteobacteria bacterium]
MRLFSPRHIRLSLLAAALMLAPRAGFAAQVPTSAQPGIVSRSLEKPDRTRTGHGEIITLPGEEKQAGKGSTQKIFVLKSVSLDKSTVYRTDDFKDAYAPYIGQKVSFADLNLIAQGMTRKYRQDGYVFSRVILPPQKIKNGALHLQAVEGRVTDVELEGDFQDKNGLIRKLAGKIRSGKGPANTKEIERYLLLINDLPGVTARSVIKPSKTPGGGDLVIAITQKRVEGAGTFDDRGSRYIGPWRGELVAAFNNVFGIHDRTTLRADVATRTKELRYGEITHEEQVGSEGLRVKARFAVTATEPGGSLSSLGIVGDGRLFDLEAVYPLLRARRRNLDILAGGTVNDTTTDLSGAKVAEDRIRTLRAGLRFDTTDGFRGVSQFELTATRGFKALNATPAGTGRSRANAPVDFLHWNATASRVQDLWWPRFSAFLSATGQYSNDPLLASEEFTLGGPGFGRAYDAGELAGDRGYAGLAELRYGGPVDSDFIQSYQAYAYIDYGKVYNLSPVVGEAARDSLTSAGFGARFNLPRAISGYAELDKPMNKQVNAQGNRDLRAIFSLTKRF